MTAKEKWLPGAYDVFDDVVARRPRSLCQTLTLGHFDLEPHFLAVLVVESDKEAANVENTAHFRRNPFQQCIKLERRAEGAPNFIQNVELLAATRRLLDQVAILDRHADLVPETEKQPQFRGREIAILPRSQQQNPKDSLFCLQADADHRMQPLPKQQPTQLTEGSLFFERFPIRVAR